MFWTRRKKKRKKKRGGGKKKKKGRRQTQSALHLSYDYFLPCFNLHLDIFLVNIKNLLHRNEAHIALFKHTEKFSSIMLTNCIFRVGIGTGYPPNLIVVFETNFLEIVKWAYIWHVHCCILHNVAEFVFEDADRGKKPCFFIWPLHCSVTVHFHRLWDYVSQRISWNTLVNTSAPTQDENMPDLYHDETKLALRMIILNHSLISQISIFILESKQPQPEAKTTTTKPSLNH